MKEIKLVLNTTPKTLKEEMREALENDTFYDFISNKGYLFSKDELIDIIKEYEYTRYKVEKYGCMGFLDELIENLEAYFFDEEEE